MGGHDLHVPKQLSQVKEIKLDESPAVTSWWQKLELIQGFCDKIFYRSHYGGRPGLYVGSVSSPILYRNSTELYLPTALKGRYVTGMRTPQKVGSIDGEFKLRQKIICSCLTRP